MKNFFSKFKYNLFLALLITFIFITIEQSFRVYNDILSFNLTLKSFFEQFFIHLLIISIVSKRVIFIIYFILTLFTWFQLVHFSYYGTWIFPLEYILFFLEFKETLLTFKSVLNIAIVPSILTLILILSVYFILNKFSSKRKQIPYLSYILIFILFFMPINLYLKDNYQKYSKPNFDYFILKNTTFTLSNLFGIIIPKKISGNSGLEQELMQTQKIINQNPNVNIVLIMGESLNRDYMSLYNYNLQTTPFLDSIKNHNDFLYKKAIGGGVSTVIAIPNFIHMIKKPDGIPQILSTNTCLFKMAKENGFNTYFYSSQAQDELKSIKSYLCTNWLDDLKDGTTITNINDKSAYDIHLLDMIENVDFTKPVFLTLQQRASHTPFKETFPEEFEIFTKSNVNSENILQNSLDYFNSIRYTDFVIEQIINKVKEKTLRPTYVIFTSDHGTNIGDENRQGHGFLENSSIYKVPFFIYSLNTKNQYLNNFGDFKYISHYQITHLISSILGYDTHYNIFNTKEDFFVTGNDLSGLGGVMQVSFDEDNNILQDDKNKGNQ